MGPFVVVQALWLFLPGYVANMAPVFAMRLFPRWNARIDKGRTWRDGRPLLGPGKTWRGVVAACLAGILVAALQSRVRVAGFDVNDFGATEPGGAAVPVLLGLALGFGAVAGDAIKSFFKRRTGRSGGAPWFPFDQLDFVVGGLLLAWLASLLLEWSGATRERWWEHEFLGDRWPVLVVLLVATPLLHYVVNVIGYKLKFKQVPW